jgi:hypothetical protein
MRRVGSIDVHAIMHKHVLLTIKGTLGIQDIRTATLFVQGINEKLTEVDHSLSLVLNYGMHYLWN